MAELWKLHAKIWFDHWTPKEGRTIMEVIRPQVRDNSQLKEINTCRTWLQAHYQSGLATIDGQMIHPGYVAEEGKLVERLIHEHRFSRFVKYCQKIM